MHTIRILIRRPRKTPFPPVRENLTDPAQHKKPGRRKGHKGTSHNRHSSKTVYHTVDKCTECGSRNLQGTTTTSKQITDIESIPQCTTATNVSYNCVCRNCKAKLEAMPDTKGTSLGPNILCVITEMWDNGTSIDSIRESLNMFGLNACKATIQHALCAIGNELASEADRIRESMSESTHLKMDETPCHRSTYIVIILQIRQKGIRVPIYT